MNTSEVVVEQKEAPLDLKALEERNKNEFYLNPHRMVIRRLELSSHDLSVLADFARLFELDVNVKFSPDDGKQCLGINSIPGDALKISISERF